MSEKVTYKDLVVICFHFTIFVVLGTTADAMDFMSSGL